MVVTSNPKSERSLSRSPVTADRLPARRSEIPAAPETRAGNWIRKSPTRPETRCPPEPPPGAGALCRWRSRSPSLRCEHVSHGVRVGDGRYHSIRRERRSAAATDWLSPRRSLPAIPEMQNAPSRMNSAGAASTRGSRRLVEIETTGIVARPQAEGHETHTRSAGWVRLSASLPACGVGIVNDRQQRFRHQREAAGGAVLLVRRRGVHAKCIHRHHDERRRRDERDA